ncbi:MAG: diguanylate cyclase [Candidatus Omnitrophica bacterium]|nr:diguanylate cyclase [Candidatus Omnitrophota bacterium]MCB9721362.1 diguanylate cyclase [Candidatus Omnitrophota bacterium]
MPSKPRRPANQHDEYRSVFQNCSLPILIKDFSVLQKLKKQLADARYRSLSAYLLRNRDMMLRVNEQARTVAANQAALELFGATNLRELQSYHNQAPSRDYLRVLSQAMAAMLSGESRFEAEFKTRALNRKYYDVILRLNVPSEQMSSLKRVIITLQDITRQKQFERNLKKMAQTDGLTELWNHSAILQRLEEEFKRAYRYNKDLSCLMIDLDHFKGINDLCGHQRGDKVLRQTAQMIRSFVREVDIVGRYGGDEFLIILPETPADKAQIVAERLVNVFDGLTNSKKGEIFSTISVGIAGVPNSTARSPKMLLAQVDRAMYRAKKAGRNTSAVVST